MLEEGSGRINVNDPRSLNLWALRLRVTKAELVDAIRAVGNEVPNVAIELGRPKGKASTGLSVNGYHF